MLLGVDVNFNHCVAALVGWCLHCGVQYETVISFVSQVEMRRLIEVCVDRLIACAVMYESF